MDFRVVPNPLPWAPCVREERGADRGPARQRCVGSLREDEDFTSRDDLSLGGRGGEVTGILSPRVDLNPLRDFHEDS